MLSGRKSYIRSLGRKSSAPSRLHLQRGLVTLAIESSCDDTCVAILEKRNVSCGNEGSPLLHIHHHEKATSNNLAFKGVHPLKALHSHQENLGKLVQRALQQLPKSDGDSAPHDEHVLRISSHGTTATVTKPDFIAVTRGPGMRSNLNAGLDFAKGLSVAWDRPLVGVHHMQAHALTPRLVTALTQTQAGPHEPPFPFLSLLISGGHTMLIRSAALHEHEELASTADIAIGDAIDKIARELLPRDVLANASSTMYGPTLEDFTFPNGERDYYRYRPPRTRSEESARYTSAHGWSLGPPIVTAKGGSRSNDLEFSFTGLCSSVKRIANQMGMESATTDVVDVAARREIATQAMRLAFEHLATRIKLALDAKSGASAAAADTANAHNPLQTIVISGGVAANKYLRHILRTYLTDNGYGDVRLVFPPPHLCVDNAIMIGWTGMEMFEQGWRSELSIRSVRKWSLDSKAEDGGILGLPGWRHTK